MAVLNIVLMMRSNRIRGLYPEMVPFAQRDHRELVIDQLSDCLLALQFRDAVGIAGAHRSGLVVQLVLGIAINRAGRSINVALHLGNFRDVAKIAGAAALKMKFLLGEYSAMGSLESPARKITWS